jgi:serine/threonine protein kinase
VTNSTSPTERVGRYQLLDPIGVGPSGSVSRAKVFGVAGFERQFAVKRFHAELTTTAAMAAMLSAAARAYGSLEHPRIARMSEFGVAQGATFTAVEYVLGLDALRLIGEARLAGVTLAAGGALALVSQAARAVGYAHGRGLTHLGLAPTNVIVTAEGDIKITDFGILSATLPPRPIDVPRLAQRIPYLAPEQLANEATSAATDVFALGVLAYELVTGNRTFKGDTPQQVASAIMAGPPAEPLLPRPIVRVLQRCLARSPFERFPDARALADALDAALRVAPVPGTRKDIGAQVKDTLDRLAALNEGQMSGMVALHLGTGPIRRPDDPPELGQDPAHHPLGASGPGEPSAYELGRPEITAGAPPVMNPGSTFQDLQRQPMTMPGVPPPPIPVPPGVGGVPLPAPPSQSGAHTLLGMGKPPALPPIKPLPRPGSASGLPTRPPAVPAAALRTGARAATDLAIPLEPGSPGVPGDAPRERDSAIHPLDPSDLVPFDAVADLGEADTVAESAGASRLNAPGSAEPAASAAAGSPSSNEPWPTRSDDAVGTDPASEPTALAPPAPSAPRTPQDRAAGFGPSQKDTRPIPPETLAPLLFDPIVRSPADEPADEANEEGERASGHAERRDAENAAMADAAWSAAPSYAAPGPGAASGPSALGKTMLGYAAPLPTPRPQAPTPWPPSAPVAESEPPGDEMAGMLLEGFRAAPGPDTAPAPGILPGWREPSGPHPRPAPPMIPEPSGGLPPDLLLPPVPPLPPRLQTDPPPPYPHTDPQPPSGAEPTVPPPMGMPLPPLAPPAGGWATPPVGVPAAAAPSGPRPQRRMLWILVGMIGAVVVAIAGWQIYTSVSTPSGTPRSGSASSGKSPDDAPVVAAAPDAAEVPPAADAAELAVAPSPDAQVAVAPPPDAARVAMASPDASVAADAGVAAVPDAPKVAALTPDAGAPPSDAAAALAVSPTSGDTLSIASTPPGARVFLDGSDHGATPAKLPGSPDRHNIALLLAGHELYVAQVDGHGTFQIPLKEVTPTNGPAGIKVLRCKDKDRYYVFVDGKPTGQTCPTERIGCEVGPHTVEVYDVVSETRRKWDIVVKDTRLSFRIRVE